ncbi:replication protein A 70 kDa DNA-binding subunit D-like [Humulus lupulus]|uniref:replication protein A 70 kDa DNA-binding subunit D-like n=1 Tax=Humulus lupulus TaxID=3486 RepID=UPI002B4083F5|nr:replication protein A 70 kDa DNA-binding subunit D-like [Humulus lupulus]
MSHHQSIEALDLMLKDINDSAQPFGGKVVVIGGDFRQVLPVVQKARREETIDATLGTRIQATIFEENIQKYEKLIIMFKTYNISNALVNFIPQQHRIVDNKYQWIINEHTTVKEVGDEEIINTPHELYNFSFVPFNALEQYKTLTMEVDILALVIDIQPQKYIPTSCGVSCVRESTLLNEEIGARPVLAAKNLKVVSYMNTSLSTKPASRLLIDPELPQAIALRTWRDENNMYLEHFVSRDLPASSNLTIPTSDALTPINTVKNLVEHKEFNEPVEKDHCNNKDGKAIPRCFVLVECEDTSGVLPVAIFGENAEKFIHCSALELMKHTTEEGIDNLETIADVSSSTQYTAQIKTYKYIQHQQTKYKYTIRHLMDISEGKKIF